MSYSIPSATRPHCPYCGALLTNVLYNDEGEAVCPSCGSVLPPGTYFELSDSDYVKYDVFEPYSKTGEGRISSRATLSDVVHDGGLGSHINPYESKGRRVKLFARLSKEQEKSRIKDSRESIEVDVRRTLSVFLSNVEVEVPIPEAVKSEIYKIAGHVVNNSYKELKGISRKERNYLAYAIALMVLDAYGIIPEPKTILRRLIKDGKTVNRIIEWLKKVKYRYARDIYLKLVKTQNLEERYINKGRSIVNSIKYHLKLNYTPKEFTNLLSFYEDLIKCALSINMNSGKQALSLLSGLAYIALNVFTKAERSKATQGKIASLFNIGNNSVRESYVEAIDKMFIVVSVPTKRRK